MRTYLIEKRGLSSEVIEADICIVHAQRVEQVEDGLRHHRRTAEVVLDVLGSVMLLEVGVARISRARARSLPHLRSRHPRARQRASLRPPRAHPAPQRLSLTMQSLRLFLVSELNHFSKGLRA